MTPVRYYTKVKTSKRITLSQIREGFEGSKASSLECPSISRGIWGVQEAQDYSAFQMFRQSTYSQKNEIPYCVFGFNEIICKTGLKHIQTLTHKCNIIKEEHFEAIWSHTMYLCGIHNFAKCVHRKGVTSFYAMTPILNNTQLYWIHRIGNCRSIQCW